MKHILIKVLAATMVIVTASAYYSNKDRYIENYLVEPEIAAILDQHSNEIFNKLKRVHGQTPQKHGVWQFDWLPGYYVKYGLARIEGMERMQRCIDEFNLDLITVADKRIYHVKGRPSELSNLNYAVVIPAVLKSQNPQPLTHEHVRQLCTIIYETSYISMTDTNYIQMDDGRLCMIDTESTFDASKILKGLLRMIGPRTNWNSYYTEEGLKYLLAEIKKRIARKPSLAQTAFPIIRERLAQQKRPYTWDYMTYTQQYFSNEGF